MKQCSPNPIVPLFAQLHDPSQWKVQFSSTADGRWADLGRLRWHERREAEDFVYAVLREWSGDDLRLRTVEDKTSETA